MGSDSAGSNSVGGTIHFMIVWCFIAQSLSLSPFIIFLVCLKFRVMLKRTLNQIINIIWSETNFKLWLNVIIVGVSTW